MARSKKTGKGRGGEEKPRREDRAQSEDESRRENEPRQGEAAQHDSKSGHHEVAQQSDQSRDSKSRRDEELGKIKDQFRGKFDPEEAVADALAGRDLLINAWHARDELYKQLFGDYAYVTPAGYAPPPPLSPADLADVEEPVQQSFGSKDTADPGDPALESQHLAVLAYGPDPFRPYWMYVTAGLSSPWLQNEPSEVSGFACELMIKSPVDSPWCAQILRTMAFYIFNHAGTLSPGTRIGFGAPLTVNSPSELNNIFIWYADEAPDCWYQLPSGGFGLFLAVGMSEAETRYAESVEEYGTWCIQQVLRQTGHGQITDPTRKCVMKRDDINGILNSVRMFAENFRNNVSEPQSPFGQF